MSSCSDRPTPKETTPKASRASSSPRCAYALAGAFLFALSSLTSSFCSLLISFVSPSISLISLPAAFPLIMSYQGSASSYSVIINHIPLSRRRLLSRLRRAASLFHFRRSRLSSASLPLPSVFVFFPPTPPPTPPPSPLSLVSSRCIHQTRRRFLV